MLPAWVYLTGIFISSFPDRIAQVEQRERFACEIISGDEGFISGDLLLDLPTEKVIRVYKFAFCGAKVLAWISMFSGEEDWQTSIIREIYRKGGLCDQAGELASQFFRAALPGSKS